MRLIEVTPAVFRPLEPALIMDLPALRVDNQDEDIIISDMIKGALRAYQQYTGNILCRSTWDLYLDAFPADTESIETPAPLDSVSQITYTDAAGASQVMAAANYLIDKSNPLVGRIYLAQGISWPATLDQANAVKVRIVAGYENAAAVPEEIKQGMILHIQAFYDGQDKDRGINKCWRNYRRITL